MDKRTKRNLAVTAGLTAVLALSPVAGPAVTALAEGESATLAADNSSENAAETVTVTFVFGRGHDNVTEECEVNGQVDYPTPYPYEEDYTIEGWYYDEALTHKWYAGDSMSKDTTLYAKWVQRYCTFTFWNASSYDDMSALEPYYQQTVTYGTNGELKKPSDPPVDEGYIFDGWYTDPECTQPWKYGIATGDTNVYAKWVKFPTVTFCLSPESKVHCDVLVNLDDNPNNRIKSLNVSSVTKLLGNEIPEGYKIEGYYADPDYTESVRVPDLASIKQDTTVYIKFNKQPVVTFDYQIDGVEDQTVTFNLGDYIDDVDVPDMSAGAPEGEEIVGWYTDPECTTPYDRASTPVTGDMTLYAKWAPKQYTVTFDDGIEGNEDITQTVVYNSLAIKPADPTREGYAFDGWYTDEECTEGNEYDFTKPVTGDMTLYAKWIQDEEPTEPEQPGTGTETPENPGTGTEEPGEGTETPGTGTETPETPGTETPAAETHKVTFDDCLASTENAVVGVEDGKTVAKPADPKCEGFTFEGWYSDTDLTEAWDFSTPVTKDMTLWAKWSKNGVDGAGVTDDTKTPATPSKDADKTASDKTASDKSALPSTGDATMAVSGLGALGTAVAGLGAFLKRRH